ncbi:sensor histidine kinase [Planktothrix mougeotii]|uniref:histidine kinase n=1 Tax=Planktothrix mougeotii LEGE 06226 TaxID=1828728 RepID=A0ABR9U7A4_9CYAN|nr:HAMP domain-containing sensor histidine kinase [Planktothrix mougeotii]MBE9142317.1 HAMP domain-containing histidine kinase [Planktothrix mougeotii LEGE 06226]
MLTASSEFVQLCRTQLSLTASLGASLSVVYLAEAWVDEEHQKLIPIATYPETSLEDLDIPGLMRFPTMLTPTLPRLLTTEEITKTRILLPAVDINDFIEAEAHREQPLEEEKSWQQRSQTVLPLIQEEVVLGFLVTGRNDRSWNPEEYGQLQGIAHTLALGCILDQRSQWFQQQLSQQQHLQAQQADALHNIFHQLKSPLTAVRTFGKLLLKRLLPDDKNYPIANSILRESDRIQELLQQADQTLDRTEPAVSLPLTVDSVLVSMPPGEEATSASSMLTLLPAWDELEWLELSEVLQPLILSTQAIAEERQLQCFVDLPPKLPVVQGNHKALREVLSNLLDNALKYTPPGGKLCIRVRLTQKRKSQPRQVGIGISDTGPGIPPEDLAHLFERHYRGVQGRSEIPGTGLGLAIAKTLVEQMQGKIEVFSPVNSVWVSKDMLSRGNTPRGTTFIVWLKGVTPDQELNRS